MHPNHIPEFATPWPPVDNPRLNGRATEAITRQRTRLEEQVGNVTEARLDPQEDTPLYGYRFNLDNGTEIQLTVDVNGDGEPVGADRDFVEARNRAATLRSRERSRGSRSLNYAYQGDRGNGPGGHGYQFERAETEYHNQLADFIARKVSGNAALNNEDLVTEAVSRSVIQEQRQMSALENMSAERKSGNKVLNFFRRHKVLRFATGVALSGLGISLVASGAILAAAPVLAARAALGADGGYLLSRTGWDAFQGRRAKKQPHDDIRMAGSNNGDFSGMLTPRAAFERQVKLLGAEARAGSGDTKRQALIQRLGSGLVREYYTGELDFSAAQDFDTIRDQVSALYTNQIRGLQTERIRSDQTQSRKRHIAGIAGGAVMGALSIAHPIGIDVLNPAGFVHDIFGGGGGGAGHGAGAHASGHGGSSAHRGGGTSGNNPSASAANGYSAGSSMNGPSGGGNIGPYANGYGAPNGSTEINIYGGAGNDTITVGSMHDAAYHGAHTGHGLGAHHLHETFDGVSTSNLHVESGGGFISTLQEQYNLSPAQADSVYHAMYGQLHGAPGTYMVGSDIRISAPGDFKLPDSARAILEKHLEALHRMPEHMLHTGVDNAGHNGATIDATTGGTKAPDYTSGGPTIDPTTGGTIAPDALSSQAHVAADPTAFQGTGGTTPGYSLTIDGGAGNDHISVLLPDANSPAGQHLQALVDGHYVAETGVGNFTPDQIAQAQYYIANFIHNGGFTGLSASAQAAAQGSIENYIQAAIEHPAPNMDAQQAADRVRQLWTALGHNLGNLTTNQAENLETDLILANAG